MNVNAFHNDFSSKFDLSVKKLLLSSEAISENSLILSSVTPIFNHYLTDLKYKTSHAFKEVENISSRLLKLDIFSNSKQKAFDNISFIDASTMLISIPEGFNGNICQYSEVMKTLYYTMTKKTTDFLTSINIELGRIINVKSNKITTENLENIYLPYQKLRLDAIEITSKFFKIGSTKSRETLGNIFDNKDDIYNTLENSNQLEKYVRSTNIKSILNLIEDTSYLLTEIENQIKIEPTIKFSPQVIQLMANGINEVAKYIEYLSTMFYDTDVLLNIVNQIYDSLIRVSSRV